jgi:hypothetical protein
MSRPKAEGEFSLNESRKGKAQERLVMRLLWMVVISVMLSLSANGSHLCHDYPVYHHAGLWTAAQ